MPRPSIRAHLCLWEDPVGGTKQQLTWTPLQGFKNFPTIFGEALASDLDSSQPENDGCWLLQYMDDVLLAAETKGKCWVQHRMNEENISFCEGSLCVISCFICV